VSDSAGDDRTEVVSAIRARVLFVSLLQFGEGGESKVGLVDRRFARSTVTLTVQNFGSEPVSPPVRLAGRSAQLSLGPADVGTATLPVPAGSGTARLSSDHGFSTDVPLYVAGPADPTVDVLDQVDLTVTSPTTTVGDDYPDIDDWLTETETGAADETYAGSLIDRRDQSSVSIDVGSEGTNGNFADGPSTVVVSTGTEIERSWIGEGNSHNVEALPEAQRGVSDYEFSSGEAEGASGVKYRRTLDTAGIVLYHCEPHISVGVKGGIAVES
jgi:halocyanin-like protein